MQESDLMSSPVKKRVRGSLVCPILFGMRNTLRLKDYCRRFKKGKIDDNVLEITLLRTLHHVGCINILLL